MDKYSDLLRAMSEAFITAVRALETENAKLKSENEFLRAELDETRARYDSWDEFMADEQAREEALGL